MPIDFYYLIMSPPCRSVMLTAKAVGVELNMKKTDIFKGENKTPEFLAINPQHSIPTMVDGDCVLWESRAICSYLASKYGKDDTLFPNDPRARAEVERLCYFDIGTLFRRLVEYVVPPMFQGEKLIPEKLERLQEGLGWLDGFLAGHKFAAGDKITIADHILLATVSTIRQANVDVSKHTNICAWLERCKTDVLGYDINEKGAEEWGKFFRSRINQS